MGRPPKFGNKEQEQLFKQGLKRCTRCEEIKPLSEFYRRSDGHSKHGYTSHCKKCTIIRTDAYHQTPHGKDIARAAIRQYFKTEKGKNARRRYEKANQLKTQARHAVNHAIEYGKLMRPDRCCKCGRICKPESHHWHGYEPEQWLDVQWLCSRCHREIHHSK